METINKQQFWNQIDKEFWKYYNLKPKNELHMSAINNYIDGLLFSQRLITGEEAEKTYELCWFCTYPLNETGVSIDKHHVIGRRNSFQNKIVHKSCHIEFHKYWRPVEGGLK